MIELERVLASKVWNFKANQLVEITCKCGCRIARDVEFLREEKKTVCSNCGCGYDYRLDKENGRYEFRIKQAGWQCVDCKNDNVFPAHELKEGKTITCANCKEPFEIIMVPQFKKLRSHDTSDSTRPATGV
jgi:hypothetical protein